jgi:hypothetical protein
MAFYERVETYWYCGMCTYSTDRKPLSRKCTACGHDDVTPAYFQDCRYKLGDLKEFMEKENDKA